jgi:transcriptional regulator GlxA family with amidase domain
MTHRRKGGLAAWQIQRLQTFMQTRLDRAISVADLASLAGSSRSHFTRGFRVSFGESPHSYLLRLRIERSLVLLKDTDLSLCRVATECGFSDQAHFNRVFKQKLAGSPGAWRRYSLA